MKRKTTAPAPKGRKRAKKSPSNPNQPRTSKSGNGRKY